MPRASRSAARALVVLLVACSALGAGRSALYLAAARGWEGLPVAGLSLERGLRSSWEMYRLVFVAAAVVFCVWIYRANRDAHRHGADLRFRPGWAVAVCFLPIVNLIAPYRAVKEIQQEAAGGAPRLAHARGPILELWWVAWIASLAWRPLSSLFLAAGADMWREAVREALLASASMLLAAALHEIESHQERRSRAALSGVERSGVLPTATH